MIKKSITYVVLAIGAVAMFLPFLWLILSTFKTNSEITAVPPTFIPNTFTLDNYSEVFKKFNIGRYFLNSTWLSVIKTAIGLYTSLLCGFVFAKYEFRFKKQIFSIVLFSMMVPYLTIVIPIYDLINKLNLSNTYTAIVVVSLFSAFGIFMMRQYMQDGVPNELIEAARLDGASEFRIFHSIAIPLSVNMISALVIFLFLWNWEDFLLPYLVLNDTKKFPLAVALSMFSGQNTTNYAGLFSATAITIIPILVVYFMAQRKFIESVAMSGIK